MNTDIDPAYFNGMFVADEDPWAYRTSWYEERKRALTLAVLPRKRYANAFEPGCANGELTAALAPRCDRLLACDFSRSAVPLAQSRVQAFPHVTVEERCVPASWPDETFDLILISEFGYYLREASLTALVAHLDKALGRDGTLVACHWARPIADAFTDAATVHRMLGGVPGLNLVATHTEPDFLLHAWVRGKRSVAQLEGLA
ncbi:methyltransferase domain-containing protein [Pigmentiphaga aceris]|uniref:Methyltransferase domain-containing protein n=2 Tax=Pigmentiphaga aceris TaxID=1940612 RepID=A0A5C0B6J9_9BURK|nr:methyltransferase domain-containing protein [Pigmentiphaga aceris]